MDWTSIGVGFGMVVTFLAVAVFGIGSLIFFIISVINPDFLNPRYRK